MHSDSVNGKLSLHVCKKLNKTKFAATCFLHMPSPQAPPTYSSTQLPSPSVFPSLISEAQRLFLLSLRGAWGLCVSAYAFDNEVATLVKNEAGGGNLSILEWRMAAFWQREAKRHKARR